MPNQPGVDLAAKLATAAPILTSELWQLVDDWLRPLIRRLDSGPQSDLRPKQLNDPIWGTIDLQPWEVALLDTMLLQRLRGVRQLGLAHYVFPGASHDRLEHVCGVVGAAEATIQALNRQIERWNAENPAALISPISSEKRNAVRLSALLHDIGHGPFSHAIEPLLIHDELNVDSGSWRNEIFAVQAELRAIFVLNKTPSPSEVLSAILVAAPALLQVVAHGNLQFSRPSKLELQNTIIATIIGAVEGPGASHLARIVSSQIDCDKLDYLARDSHHTGLKIGFDTDRLLAKLEVLRVEPSRLDAASSDLAQKARSSPHGYYLDIGIAASGFGSFEQMLVGRTFLYDRLYHHHKVRAADAMAQRLAMVAERERGKALTPREIFLPAADDTTIRILGGLVEHPEVKSGGAISRKFAEAILSRSIFHRAFVFRGRFIACPAGLLEGQKEDLRRVKWMAVSRELDDLSKRRRIEARVFQLSLDILNVLVRHFSGDSGLDEAAAYLSNSDSSAIIIDLPPGKTDTITTLARYPDNSLKIPEFSFNPIKWAAAYELQKRTGYVFCPRELVIVAAVASRLIFLNEFGISMSRDADAHLKNAVAIPRRWQEALVADGVAESAAFEYLEQTRFLLLQLREEDIPVPDDWVSSDPDFPVRVARAINVAIPAGLLVDDLEKFKTVFLNICRFVDAWHAGSDITDSVMNEADIQSRLKRFLIGQGLNVIEGEVASGGKADLRVEDRIVIENKFTRSCANPFDAFPDAGSQVRRYAIALGSRVTFVVIAYVPEEGRIPSKTDSIAVRKNNLENDRRAEIRVVLPYSAVTPSREAAPFISARRR